MIFDSLLLAFILAMALAIRRLLSKWGSNHPGGSAKVYLEATKVGGTRKKVRFTPPTKVEEPCKNPTCVSWVDQGLLPEGTPRERALGLLKFKDGTNSTKKDSHCYFRGTRRAQPPATSRNGAGGHSSANEGVKTQSDMFRPIAVKRNNWSSTSWSTVPPMKPKHRAPSNCDFPPYAACT